MKRIVVAGTGTGIGKTFVSAILVEALEADYWKPVQAGNLDYTDTDCVKQYISNSKTIYHPEGYRLLAPMSPHAAAAAEGIAIDLNKLSVPLTANNLIIELAGGLMVPLNNRELNTDLIRKWNLPLILVSENYLGSINHTLLSVEVLKRQGVRVLGIIFNGEANQATEEFIEMFTGLPILARINRQKEINKKTVKRIADDLKHQLNQFI